MLYNVYRPQRFSDVVGQTDVIENLASQSKRDKFFGVYILCGQYGSGKTTTARILAMAANCKHKDIAGNPCCQCEDCKSIIDGSAVDVQEIAAAVSTGVDKVREICENVSYLPVALKRKVYIIDEVQALSKAAFQAFLKMLEEPPAHAMFILATTDVGAIPPTVRSRAATYYFRQLSQTEISAHCKKVAGMEGLSVTEDACDVIAKYSQGSMRNALSLLDMATQEGPADGSTVERLLGVSTSDAVFSIIQSVMCGDAAAVIEQVTKLAAGGADLSVLVADMLQVAADLTVAAVSRGCVKGAEHYLVLIDQTLPAGTSTRFSALTDEIYNAKVAMARQPDLSVLLVALVRASRRTDIVQYKDAPNEEVRMLRSLVSDLTRRLDECERKLVHGVVAAPVIDTVDDSEPESEAEECQPMPIAEEEETVKKIEPVSYEVPHATEDVAEQAAAEAVVTESAPEESEEDIFAFLGLVDAKKADTVASANLDRLADVPMIRAALSCCEVTENGGDVTISTDLPVAKRFLKTCFDAYERQGYKTAGISFL